jgi:hypothetical protein
MLLGIALILLVVWIVSVLMLHAGSFINLAVLIAVVFIVWHMFTSREKR